MRADAAARGLTLLKFLACFGMVGQREITEVRVYTGDGWLASFALHSERSASYRPKTTCIFVVHSPTFVVVVVYSSRRARCMSNAC